MKQGAGCPKSRGCGARSCLTSVPCSAVPAACQCTSTMDLSSPPTITRGGSRPACPPAPWTQHTWLRGSAPIPAHVDLAGLGLGHGRDPAPHRPHRALRPRHSESDEEPMPARGQRAQAHSRRGCRRGRPQESRGRKSRQGRAFLQSASAARLRPSPPPAWFWGHQPGLDVKLPLL